MIDQPCTLTQTLSTGCKTLCRDLAHLYHYYLHGPSGNAKPKEGGSSQQLPNGERRPDIRIEHLVGSRLVWSRSLWEVRALRINCQVTVANC